MYSEYPSVIERYTDASWNTEIENNDKLISGWIFTLGREQYHEPQRNKCTLQILPWLLNL